MMYLINIPRFVPPTPAQTARDVFVARVVQCADEVVEARREVAAAKAAFWEGDITQPDPPELIARLRRAQRMLAAVEAEMEAVLAAEVAGPAGEAA